MHGCHSFLQLPNLNLPSRVCDRLVHVTNNFSQGWPKNLRIATFVWQIPGHIGWGCVVVYDSCENFWVKRQLQNLDRLLTRIVIFQCFTRRSETLHGYRKQMTFSFAYPKNLYAASLEKFSLIEAASTPLQLQRAALQIRNSMFERNTWGWPLGFSSASYNYGI